MSSSNAQARAGQDDAAAVLLDWLGGLLSAPLSTKAVAACRSHEGTTLFEAIAAEPGCGPGLDLIRGALATDDTDEATATRLSGSYTRLFDGPGGPATVSLYESSYSGLAHRLHQQASTEMDDMLRRCNMGVRAGYAEPADHLSLEVALLATLLRTENSQPAYRLGQRLLSWIPGVTLACASVDRIGFYHGVLMALHGTLKSLPTGPVKQRAS